MSYHLIYKYFWLSVENNCLFIHVWCFNVWNVLSVPTETRKAAWPVYRSQTPPSLLEEQEGGYGIFFGGVFETGSPSWLGVSIKIIFPQLPKCWGNRYMQCYHLWPQFLFWSTQIHINRNSWSVFICITNQNWRWEKLAELIWHLACSHGVNEQHPIKLVMVDHVIPALKRLGQDDCPKAQQKNLKFKLSLSPMLRWKSLLHEESSLPPPPINQICPHPHIF